MRLYCVSEKYSLEGKKNIWASWSIFQQNNITFFNNTNISPKYTHVAFSQLMATLLKTSICLHFLMRLPWLVLLLLLRLFTTWHLIYPSLTILTFLLFFEYCKPCFFPSKSLLFPLYIIDKIAYLFTSSGLSAHMGLLSIFRT